MRTGSLWWLFSRPKTRTFARLGYPGSSLRCLYQCRLCVLASIMITGLFEILSIYRIKIIDIPIHHVWESLRYFFMVIYGISQGYPWNIMIWCIIGLKLIRPSLFWPFFLCQDQNQESLRTFFSFVMTFCFWSITQQGKHVKSSTETKRQILQPFPNFLSHELMYWTLWIIHMKRNGKSIPH